MPLRRPLVLFALLLALLPAAHSQEAGASAEWGLEYSNERQRLDNGGPDWRESTLRLQRSESKRQLAAISASRHARFGLEDEQYALQLIHPLGPWLTTTLDANYSGSHRFLPEHGLGLMLQYEFAPAWLMHGGNKRTIYPDAIIDQQTLMLEHYFSAFSTVLAWRPVQALGTRAASTELRGAYHYNDDDTIGLSATTGQEAIQISSTQIEVHGFVALALTGHHRMARHWTVSYALSSTRLADLYDRKGLRLGVLYLF